MNNLPTISLCMIVKNEANNISKCISPLKDFVDEIIIVDTGSTDDTVKIATELGCRAEHFEWIDDFSAARNFSFSFATKEWVFWIDADDVVSNAHLLKPVILSALSKSPTTTCIILPYIYAKDEFGNPAVTLLRERLLKNNGTWTWERRVHEYLTYPPDCNPLLDEAITIVHEHAANAGNRQPRRNLDILEKELAEIGMENADTRLLAYVGEERRAIGDLQGALDIWNYYLTKSTWIEEKYQILCKMGNILNQSGDKKSALAYATNANLTLPTWGDAFLLYATYFLETGELDKAIHFADEVLRCGVPKTHLIVNPLEYTFAPNMIKFYAYRGKGDLDNAIDCINKAIALRPLQEVINMRNEVQSMIRGKQLVESAVQLSSIVPPIFIEQFLTALPLDIRSTPPIEDIMWSRVISQKQCADKQVDIFVGHGLEPWDKRNIDTIGIGGSETAVVHIAEAFNSRGYNVTVYGNPPNQSVDGRVIYTHARYFDPKKPRDIFISSRIPQVMADVTIAKKKVLYLHDINVADGLDEKCINNTDTFVFVSEFQKQHYLALYPGLDEAKCHVVSNGIPYDKMLALQSEGIKRDPLRFIWSSSPDRGLETLLQMFPRIREKYPKASLHIFYGWDNIDKCIQMGNENLKYFKERIMEMVKQPRVFWRGRLPQSQLHREMLKTSFWLYPTTFLETNCITALECRMSGVFPIVSAIGGLLETVGLNGDPTWGDVGGAGGALIEGSPLYLEVQDKFIARLDDAINARNILNLTEFPEWWKIQIKLLKDYDWGVKGQEFVELCK